MSTMNRISSLRDTALIGSMQIIKGSFRGWEWDGKVRKNGLGRFLWNIARWWTSSERIKWMLEASAADMHSRWSRFCSSFSSAHRWDWATAWADVFGEKLQHKSVYFLKTCTRDGAGFVKFFVFLLRIGETGTLTGGCVRDKKIQHKRVVFFFF